MRGGDDAVGSIRATAADAAAAAGALIRASFGKLTIVDGVAAHDLKLRLDREAETEIITLVRRRFPADGILSEEAGYLPGESPFLWITDPLDGTVNFFHGIPMFCTCVSCHLLGNGDAGQRLATLPDGRAVGDALAAVVYCPLSEELFTAGSGCGAALNGRPLHPAPLTDFSAAIVSISLNAHEANLPFAGRLVPRLAARARKVRCFGSTALEIALVAAGRTGAFVQMGTNLWDFAAAACVLKEAGGVVDAREYAPGRWKITASNPGIAEEMRRLVEE